MVSTADAPTQGLPSVSKVAALLGASESEVTGLLEQGMLKGTSENRDSVGVLDRALESIRGCWLFDGLDTRQMLEIAALVEEQSLGAEELLLREGDEVLHFFVVIEGPRGGPA